MVEYCTMGTMVLARTDLAVRLAELLRRHDIAIDDLSRRTGIASGTIKNWHSGRTETISLENIALIAGALGYDVGVLAQYFHTGALLPDPDMVLFYEGWQQLSDEGRQAVKDVMLKAMIRRARGEDA